MACCYTHEYVQNRSSDDVYRHLMDFSVNKEHQMSIRRKANEIIDDSTWSFEFCMTYMLKQGMNVELLMHEMERVIRAL